MSPSSILKIKKESTQKPHECCQAALEVEGPYCQRMQNMPAHRPALMLHSQHVPLGGMEFSLCFEANLASFAETAHNNAQSCHFFHESNWVNQNNIFPWKDTAQGPGSKDDIIELWY